MGYGLTFQVCHFVHFHGSNKTHSFCPNPYTCIYIYISCFHAQVSESTVGPRDPEIWADLGASTNVNIECQG